MVPGGRRSDLRSAIRRSLERGEIELQTGSSPGRGGLWCKQSDYLEVLFGVNKEILEEFRRQKIEIPFPQREVRVSQANGGDGAGRSARAGGVLAGE